jgi:ceramide glucosyltransferase
MAKFLKKPCVIGKSMLMRRSDFEEMGGFESVKDFLAEDYIIGERMARNGKKVIISDHMIKNVNEYWSMKRFLNRHARWGKLRWKIGGIRYFSELISNAVFLAWMPVLLHEPSELTVSFAVLVSVTKALGDFYLNKMIGVNNTRLHYFLSPIKDLLIGVIWFMPLLSDTVNWRGNKYRIRRGSLLTPNTHPRYETILSLPSKVAYLFVQPKSVLLRYR